MVLTRVFLAALLAGLCLAGCGRGPERPDTADRQSSAAGTEQTENSGADKLKVVATLFPYYDFTRQIAGDCIDLELVIPAGMDSHSFEPTPAHMRMIEEADLLICNGGVMEHWVSQVLEASDRPERVVVTMMDCVDVVQEEIVEGMEDEANGHDHDAESGAEGTGAGQALGYENPEAAGSSVSEGLGPVDPDLNAAAASVSSVGSSVSEGLGPVAPDLNAAAASVPSAGSLASERPAPDGSDNLESDIEYDEHIWTSPLNAMKITEAIAEALSAEDPAHAAIYEAGAEAYLAELREIDRGFTQVSEARKRDMIIVGDKFPFRYLADAYDLTYRAAFSGCSTDTEPSARTIAYLIDQVKERQIPVVYYLELSSTRVAEIISEETGAVPLLLHSCHNVTRRELEDGVTYVDLMRQNIENLRKGLDE